MASHTVLKEQLSEMGFDESLITKALGKLGEKATIESTINAIEDLMNKTSDDETTDENKNGDKETDEQKTDKPDDQNSVVDDEKEREKKLIAYEQKIKQRRIEREAKEKEEELKREIKRREDGKGMGKMKEELEQLQRKKVAEEMRREKEEAKAAKDAVLAAIARDREEQRQSRISTKDPNPSAPTAIVTPQPTVSAVAKDGKCRLAIRLLDGKQLINEFDNRETLSAVRVYVITQSGTDSEISFVMPPLPPFTEDDMQKPLNALGLCPSARVHVIKR